MPISQQEFQERFQKLPAPIKDAMVSVETAEKIYALGKKFGLTVDKIGALAEEIGNVMAGIVKPSELISILQTRLGTDTDKTKDITQEVNHQIFYPIREMLKAAHRFEISTETIQKPNPLIRKPVTSAPGAPTPTKETAPTIEIKDGLEPRPAPSIEIKTGTAEKPTMPPNVIIGMPQRPVGAAPKSTAPSTPPVIQSAPKPTPAPQVILPQQPMATPKPMTEIPKPVAPTIEKNISVPPVPPVKPETSEQKLPSPPQPPKSSEMKQTAPIIQPSPSIDLRSQYKPTIPPHSPKVPPINLRELGTAKNVEPEKQTTPPKPPSFFTDPAKIGDTPKPPLAQPRSPMTPPAPPTPPTPPKIMQESGIPPKPAPTPMPNPIKPPEQTARPLQSSAPTINPAASTPEKKSPASGTDPYRESVD